MQGFVPERSFTKDRRVIDMRIDSVLMVCGTPDQCYRQITDFIEIPAGSATCWSWRRAGFLSHADTVDSLTLMAKEIVLRLNEDREPETAQNAVA
jgi:hypothetical protein